MEISFQNIRAHRLRAHHLAEKLPPGSFERAAGACGVQNSPPGAWETALHARVKGCTLPQLQNALYIEKSLLQAWSCRGVPLIFPTGQSEVFLSPLIAQPGEEPWVYTRGVTAALDFLQMRFDELLPLVKRAAGYLDEHTVQSKETLDRVLAERVAPELPVQKQALWNAPSMYGPRQTVGGAVVSFLLRPCSFSSLVVFGERRDGSPTFTSFRRWTGRAPTPVPDAGRELTRKFLHCYGPATVASFMGWLGCSPRQAARLWSGIADEMEPVQVEGKTCFLLTADRDSLQTADGGSGLALLGAHDPYLDVKDRAVILPHKALHKLVWKTVANPGVILKEGRVAGIWTPRRANGKLDAPMTLWEPLSPGERRQLKELVEEYAAFHGLSVRSCTVADV